MPKRKRGKKLTSNQLARLREAKKALPNFIAVGAINKEANAKAAKPGPKAKKGSKDDLVAGLVEMTEALQSEPRLASLLSFFRKTPSKEIHEIDLSGKKVGMGDSHVHDASALIMSGALSEKIDPTLLMKEKEYTFLWTNRVAMWRFFERYISPVLKREDQELGFLLEYQAKLLSEATGVYVDPYNPFAPFAKAFPAVMETWSPLMKRTMRIFMENNPGGMDLRDDFLSISYIAFLHALEKQAMAMVGSLQRAQGIPFSKRLEFAIRKAIRCDLPDMTGPVRVPIESEARQQMPVSVSLDALFGDGNQEN